MQINKDLREFIELLNANKVEYLVVGAFAVAWYGYPRSTADIDLFVRAEAANAERILQTLGEFGFGGIGLAPEDLSKPDQVIQLGVKPNRIDLITSVASVTFEEAWQSRVAASIAGVPVPVLALDLLLRNKEAVARPQDLADAHNLRKRLKRKP